MYSQNPLHNSDSDGNEFVLIVDKNGIIVSFNNILNGHCGYSWNEVIGQPYSMLFHSDIQTKVDDAMYTVMRGEAWEGYLKRSTKSGESFWVHSTISPIGRNGEFLSCCRKALDEEIANYNPASKITF